MVSERSVGNLLLVLVALGLLGASLASPWFEYEHSTGRRAPAGGFHDPSQTGVIHQEWTAQPGSSGGEAQPEDQAAVAKVTDRMLWTVYAAGGLLLLVALGEIPGISRVIVRRVSLTLSVLALLAVVAVLLQAWFLLPEAFGNGVHDAYTSYLDDSGYTMTALRAGWVLAALSIPAIFGGFLLKFQAGAPDPTVVVDLYIQGEI